MWTSAAVSCIISFLNSVYCRSSRERSDSIDSHSTTASLSTDDSEFSRAATPDIRTESPAYLPMNFNRKSSSTGKLSCWSGPGTLKSDLFVKHVGQTRNENYEGAPLTTSPQPVINRGYGLTTVCWSGLILTRALLVFNFLGDL